MKIENYNIMSEEAYNRYKPNIDKSQKTPKNMFKLGYEASLLENSVLINNLQHYQDTTLGLYATDKSIESIANSITKELSEKFNLKSVDSFDINQSIIEYLSSIIFQLNK